MNKIEGYFRNMSSELPDQNLITNNDFLIQLIFTSITIIASFFVAFYMIILQERRQQKNIVIDSCNSLIDDINLSKQMLPGKNDEDILNTLDKNPQPLQDLFPVDTYLGIISSANYIQMNQEVRVTLASFYNRLKEHNAKVIYLNQMLDRTRIFQLTNNSTEIVIAEIKKSIVTIEGQLIILREDCLDKLNEQIALVRCEYD
jgi:hypothetical protein